METSRGLGGLVRIRTLPNSDEPMCLVSSANRAGEGPKRGHFVSGAIYPAPLALAERALKFKP